MRHMCWCGSLYLNRKNDVLTVMVEMLNFDADADAGTVVDADADTGR